MDTLHISISDYSAWEGELGVSAPFALWCIGDLPLLYCWLDLAFESDYGHVVFHCPPATKLTPESLELLHLWPVKTEFCFGDPPTGAVRLESFCQGGIAPPMADAWSLLDHHWEMTKDRLEVLWREFAKQYKFVHIGRFSQVHATAKLIEPYWIGEGAWVGPGATIGPRASICSQSVIGAGAKVENTHVGPGTSIAEDCQFDGFFLQEGRVLNRAKRIKHDWFDPAMVRFRPQGSALPPWEACAA